MMCAILARDSPFVPFRPRLFFVLHFLFGPVCFVSVRTFLVLAGVPVRSPSLFIYNYTVVYNCTIVRYS